MELLKRVVANGCNGLFVTDLDGTLLTDNKQILEKEIAALSRLQRNKIVTVIATGRSDYSFNRLIEKLEESGQQTFPIDFVIFSTGAGVMSYPDRKLIKSSALDPHEVEKVCGKLDELALDYMVHRSVPNTRNFLHTQHGTENPDFKTRLAMYQNDAMPLTRDSLAMLGHATEVLCIVPVDRGMHIAEILCREFDDLSVIKATSPLDGKSIWIEIFPASVSKGLIIKWMAKELEIETQHICAVGNDYNDEDMLHFAGQSYMVANAPKELKQMFPIVASNNHGGVSGAISAWLELMRM